MTAQIFFYLQITNTFRSQERLVNIARGRECFVGLSNILFIYDLTYFDYWLID